MLCTYKSLMLVLVPLKDFENETQNVSNRNEFKIIARKRERARKSFFSGENVNKKIYGSVSNVTNKPTIQPTVSITK